MPRKEAYAVLSLGAIMAFRMLGLFMILPVFAVAATHLAGANATLIGLAIGAYGFTQACLQIPFGHLSDRIGRKPVIALGLILFALGSGVAALSSSMVGVIIGRALQGTGAIGSTCLALTADLTRDENRSKAMATIGMTIGLSFCIAIIIGPLVYAHFQLSGIFWFTVLLSLIALLLLWWAVPPAPRLQRTDSTQAPRYRDVFTHRALLQMDLCIFMQHAILTILFLALPSMLKNQLHLSAHQQTVFYLVILAFAFIAMVPFIIVAEKKRKMKGTLLGAIAVIFISQLLLWRLPHWRIDIGLVLFLFFTAFTLLESILPSLVSKIAPLKLKGTAMGVYSTSQFAGIFFGGVLGGWVLNHFALPGLFMLSCILALIWGFSLIKMAQPPYLSTIILPLPAHFTHGTVPPHLTDLSGVADIALSPTEQLIYIKADKQLINENELRNAIEQANLSEPE